MSRPVGRPKGIGCTPMTKQRIRVGKLVGRLQRHALGVLEMTPTQIKAAEILLNKTMPNLKSVDHTGAIQHSHVRELSDEQLATIATGGSLGIAPEAAGEIESEDLH